jgi:serine/threonine protein kinase
VRGENLDTRTDLFSFGLVLYEMATGHRAFSGETAAVLHDAILNHTPVPVHELDSTLPPKLASIITKAIEKDPELRYQSAAEIRADIETVNRIGQKYDPRSVWRRWKMLASVAFVLAASILGLLYRQSHKRPVLTEKDTIVLANFANSTGDPIFDAVLEFGLGRYLSQSPSFNQLSDWKVQRALALMKKPVTEPLTYEVAKEVCVQSNSQILVGGSISDAGNRFRLQLKAVDCQNGHELATATSEADDRNTVLKALGQAGNQLRKELGESPDSLRKFNVPLEQLGGSSLEALHA